MTPRTAEIISLAKKRVRPGDIARQLEMDVDNVYQCISTARKRGEEIPHFNRKKLPDDRERECLARQIVVPVRLFSLLQAASEQTGKTPSEMAAQLLEAGLLKRSLTNG